MPKNLQIDLTAASEEAEERSSIASPNALVPAKSYPLVGEDVRPTVHAKPSWWRRWGLWLGLAAAGGFVGWLFYAQPWVTGPAPVVLEIVAPGPVTRVLAVNGRIAALYSVDVKSTVAGTLVAPMADEGDVVPRGAILARLDDTSQQAALRQAAAALAQAKVAQQTASNAFDRAKALGANVSRTTLDDARSAMDQADQEVRRSRAFVDQAEFLLTKFSIRAPISGTVLTRSVEPGQVVDLSTPLFTLANLENLIVETDVDESYATQVRPGMPALLQLTGDSRTLRGSVSFVAPVVDAETGGLTVKITFDEPQQAPVGLTVTANIIVDRREAAISAPRSAVVTTESGPAVFVLVDGKARLTPVSVIDWPADRMVVTEGLKADDRLIIDAHGLTDGQSVAATGQ